MADIYCSRCGEPWEMDCLHDEVSHRYRTKPWILNDRGVHDLSEGKHDQKEYEKYFSIVKKDFYARGCVALTAYNDTECEPNEYGKRRGEVNSILNDIMGDDIDGMVAGMEDAEMMGLFD